MRERKESRTQDKQYLIIYIILFKNDVAKATMTGKKKRTEMTLEDLRENAGQACALLKVLANEDRLLLLCHLMMMRMNVGALEEATGIRQPTLSQQLAVLRQERLVNTEKEGKFVYYRLADENVVRVMRTLWEIYCAPT